MKHNVRRWLSALLAAAMLICMTAGLTGCDDSGMVEDPLTATYRNFVQQHYSKNYIAVRADVTHDGTDELIVVDYSKEETDFATYGYIYAYRDGKVKLLSTKTDATFHAGGQYFSLALRPIGGGYYNIISEFGTLYQGFGELELTEYYINPNTGNMAGINTRNQFVNHGTVTKDDEWERYVAACNRTLQDTYIVYVYAWDYSGGKDLPSSMIVSMDYSK